jgi:hypothetical protein
MVKDQTKTAINSERGEMVHILATLSKNVSFSIKY